MKTCSICKEGKSLEDFNKRAIAKDGRRSSCRDCQSLSELTKRRTKEGLIAEIIHTQKRNSKKRKMDQPNYSTKELYSWAISQPVFTILYNAWVDSDYFSELRPSIDRKDDYKPYIFSNIQLMTWRENMEKIGIDVKSGVNKKALVPVVQYNKNTDIVINTFYSIAEAMRQTKVKDSSIVNCCKGRYETAGGFKWGYQNDST